MRKQEAEKILESWLNPVLGFALKRCKTPEDAEDLTNDCFEKIWNSPLALELQSEEEFMLFAQRTLHNLT